ncbi:hypothetical protein EJ06DRAFT_462335, partial [Trichodelitschia bisporula]
APPVLPSAILDLHALNAAFLTALTLHYAHHPSTSPVDIRTITPIITKAWGVRKTTLDDVRLLLGVTLGPKARRGSLRALFTLTTLRPGVIALELHAQRRAGTLAAAFDEKAVGAQFRARLGAAWRQWSAMEGQEDVRVFVRGLPRAEIIPLRQEKAAAYLDKGQRRLEDVLGKRLKRVKLSEEEDVKIGLPSVQAMLKQVKFSDAGVEMGSPSVRSAMKQVKASDGDVEMGSPSVHATPAAASPMQVSTPGSRGLGLLERIRAKEAAAALAPVGPSAAEKARLAALQRASEVLDIIDMLAAGRGGMRVSFPLHALVRDVQNSIRSPMGREEVESVLKVLEKEVAPGYVGMVEFGGVKGVVVQRGLKPNPTDVKGRVAMG